MPSKVNK